MEQDIVSLTNSGDVLFMMLGAVMVFAMHGGFAFLEVGTVRKKNQVNALVKILVDFSISTIIYFSIGYAIAYGVYFLQPAKALVGSNQGYELVHFFFLLTFAAAIPAIISGGIAERSKFGPRPWPPLFSWPSYIRYLRAWCGDKLVFLDKTIHGLLD